MVRSLGFYALLLCACSADNFVVAPSVDGGVTDAPVASGDAQSADASPSDSHLCARFTPTPQFCMDFDDGSKTTAYVNGASTQITPVENGGGTVKLVPGATSPGSVLTTTPASMNATTMPRAYYGPISLKTNPSGDYRMFAAVYVPAGGPTLGNPQETRLMAFSFVKSGTQKQIAVWVAALTNNKLALEYSQVDGSNTPDFQSVEFANPTAGALFALDVHLKAGKPCELRVVQNSTETVVASITNVTPLFGEGDVQSASFGQVVYPTMPSVAALFDDVVIP